MESLKLDFPALPPASQDSEDWAYPMRREMQEILPGLFLGPYSSAMKSKLPMLQKCGMTHIVCIRQNIEANFIKPNFQQLFRYLVLDIADNPIQNIIRFFPMTKEFIDGCLHNGGKVLIHGNAGISRSAALVIAYIMETFGIKYSYLIVYGLGFHVRLSCALDRVPVRCSLALCCQSHEERGCYCSGSDHLWTWAGLTEEEGYPTLGVWFFMFFLSLFFTAVGVIKEIANTPY
uniref:Serine/threonine/tyrosine interacting protein n=1 Tax=Leptobrachium leishanense TaxID=445787 RepID=A0A8C5R7M2_9ANUR